MVAAMAPKAHLTIINYNAPNSERGFVDAVATAAGDAGRHPAAVSISWGSSEDNWSPQGIRGLDSAFATGALHGVTFSAAAGDAGSSNDELDGFQHPEFPASSPHVWACGGTTLLAARGRIRTETVWKSSHAGPSRRQRCQRSFPGPRIPGCARHPAEVCRQRRSGPRPSRRIGQRGSAHGMECRRTPPAAVDRRDERRRADVHRFVDTRLSAARAAHRPPASAAVRASRAWLQRRHLRRHRRSICGAARVGSREWLGEPQRSSDGARPRRSVAGARESFAACCRG